MRSIINLKHASVSKETYVYGKRDLLMRSIIYLKYAPESKEVYVSGKRNLQCGKRDLLIRQKRPMYTAKETTQYIPEPSQQNHLPHAPRLQARSGRVLSLPAGPLLGTMLSLDARGTRCQSSVSFLLNLFFF